MKLFVAGSLTEREIRASVMDACKDLGIKCTGRGTIAGKIRLAVAILILLIVNLRPQPRRFNSLWDFVWNRIYRN